MWYCELKVEVSFQMCCVYQCEKKNGLRFVGYVWNDFVYEYYIHLTLFRSSGINKFYIRDLGKRTIGNILQSGAKQGKTAPLSF